MLKTRALAKRRRAVRNIWKITRTMGLIATARFRRAADRALAMADYTGHLESILEHLRVADWAHKSPYWRAPSGPEACRYVLLIASNRGLCGGYNTALVRVLAAYWQKHNLAGDGNRWRLEISGKRAASMLRFSGITPAEIYTHFGEKLRAEDVDVLAGRFWDLYLTGALASLDVVYMALETLSRQTPLVERLLPPAEAGGRIHKESAWELPTFFQFELLPEAIRATNWLIREVFFARLKRAFFDAAASEQIARMIAMRAATENAENMLSRLAMMYNRARQTQITSELVELMSAAEALQR
ncbi:MAG: F0F1 ATP synthase subunit gamma [Thermoguttaceae bacterium]|nr:F0F1 ATP synthase subunit gamma [Thermoguttaceae bacterium]MDW8079686.1 FoF1 ATP synthase subunit gamma [Thermoguttaceae bacterium]